MDTQETESTLPTPEDESIRRIRSDSPARNALPQAYTMQPSLRGSNRDLRAALIELERLMRAMAPEDIERLLDYARRLAR